MFLVTGHADGSIRFWDCTQTSMKHLAIELSTIRVTKIYTESISIVAALPKAIVWIKPQKMIQDFLRDPHGANESATIP